MVRVWNSIHSLSPAAPLKAFSERSYKTDHQSVCSGVQKSSLGKGNGLARSGTLCSSKNQPIRYRSYIAKFNKTYLGDVHLASLTHCTGLPYTAAGISSPSQYVCAPPRWFPTHNSCGKWSLVKWPEGTRQKRWEASALTASIPRSCDRAAMDLPAGELSDINNSRKAGP